MSEFEEIPQPTTWESSGKIHVQLMLDEESNAIAVGLITSEEATVAHALDPEAALRIAHYLEQGAELVLTARHLRDTLEQMGSSPERITQEIKGYLAQKNRIRFPLAQPTGLLSRASAGAWGAFGAGKSGRAKP